MTTYAVAITVNTSGDGTGYTPDVNGYVESIRYVKPASGGYDNNVTLAVTGETTGAAILALAAASMDASVTKNPRAAVHAVADGAALLYAAGGAAVTDRLAIAGERIKLVVDAGGESKTGTFYVTVTGPTG